MQVPWQKKYYRPYLKDVMRSVWGVFTDVCLSTGGGSPWSLVPDPYPVSGLRTFLGQEGLGLPQSCDWSCPKSCTRSFPGHGRRYPTTENQDGCACGDGMPLAFTQKEFPMLNKYFQHNAGYKFSFWIVHQYMFYLVAIATEIAWRLPSFHIFASEDMVFMQCKLWHLFIPLWTPASWLGLTWHRGHSCELLKHRWFNFNGELWQAEKWHFWWLVELPMWLTDGFLLTFFGRWRGQCAHTLIPVWLTCGSRTQ